MTDDEVLQERSASQIERTDRGDGTHTVHVVGSKVFAAIASETIAARSVLSGSWGTGAVFLRRTVWSRKRDTARSGRERTRCAYADEKREIDTIATCNRETDRRHGGTHNGC